MSFLICCFIQRISLAGTIPNNLAVSSLISVFPAVTFEIIVASIFTGICAVTLNIKKHSKNLAKKYMGGKIQDFKNWVLEV